MNKYFYDDEYGVVFADREHRYFYVSNVALKSHIQGYESFIYAYGITKGDRDTWNVNFDEITKELSLVDVEKRYAIWIIGLIQQMSFTELKAIKNRSTENGLMHLSVIEKFNEIISAEYKSRISNFLFKIFMFASAILILILTTVYVSGSLVWTLTLFSGFFIILSVLSIYAEIISYYNDSTSNYTYDKNFSIILVLSFSFATLPLLFDILKMWIKFINNILN